MFFHVKTYDAADGTKHVSVQLGTIEVGRYASHTRHVDIAERQTAYALASLLQPFLDAAMAARNMELVYRYVDGKTEEEKSDDQRLEQERAEADELRLEKELGAS